MKTATTSYRCVRLRVGTRARSIDGRGIAISAGTSAVIVDDAGAQALWTTIEPVLRAGVEPERLMATAPRRGRGGVAVQDSGTRTVDSGSLDSGPLNSGPLDSGPLNSTAPSDPWSTGATTTPADTWTADHIGADPAPELEDPRDH